MFNKKEMSDKEVQERIRLMGQDRYVFERELIKLDFLEGQHFTPIEVERIINRNDRRMVYSKEHGNGWCQFCWYVYSFIPEGDPDMVYCTENGMTHMFTKKGFWKGWKKRYQNDGKSVDMNLVKEVIEKVKTGVLETEQIIRTRQESEMLKKLLAARLI